jgi:hypothetical protein
MPVSLRLGPALEERLAKASRKLRVNKTEVIKRSLEAYLAQVEPGRSPYDLGADLFGADEGRETDRSSRFKGLLARKLRGKHRR